MKICFVTGTGTDVGKTTVSVALLTAALQRGLRAGCMKPVESGCMRNADGSLLPRDAERLRRAANIGQELDDICQYRFERAVAPGVAAASLGISIELGRIDRAYQRLCALDPDFALIEGAGGLLVPFSGDMLVVDLISRLDLPLLIVARPDLGTINHTLLTVEAAASRGLRIAGIIFACAQPGIDLEFLRSNREEIRKRTHAPCLGVVPHLPIPLQEKESSAVGAPILAALLERL